MSLFLGTGQVSFGSPPPPPPPPPPPNPTSSSNNKELEENRMKSLFAEINKGEDIVKSKFLIFIYAPTCKLG